jgi:hypothetical protein
VAGGLSLGGEIYLGYSALTDLARGWALGMGARVGYAQRLADRVLVWPSASATYVHSWSSGSANPDEGRGMWLLQLKAPLILEPARHMFVGLGPMIVHIPSQHGVLSTTEYGLQSTLGGWF